jgi:hypothetical protein
MALGAMLHPAQQEESVRFQHRIGAPDRLTRPFAPYQSRLGQAIDAPAHSFSAGGTISRMTGGHLLVGTLGVRGIRLGMFPSRQLAEQHIGAEVAVGDGGVQGLSQAKGWDRIVNLRETGLANKGLHRVLSPMKCEEEVVAKTLAGTRRCRFLSFWGKSC